MSNEIKIEKTTLLLMLGLVIVVMFGAYLVFFNVGNSKEVTGTQTDKTLVNAASGSIQEVYLKASGSGYDKSEISVKKGIPVRFHFSAKNAGCGSQLVIYGMNVNVISRNGEDSVAEFTPEKEGTYEFNCGMRMFPPWRFVVN